ncbi:MAG TPA: glycoside hydrolase family 3 C-terminal domain-containing protein, partial [Ilumatobacteraceae bacterium]
MSRPATDEDIEQLVDSLTLDEQVALLAGADFWHTVPIDRAGIPQMRVSDGPAGARGTLFEGGPASVNVPCGTSLAATWDPALVEEIGHLLGVEARAKGARVLLAPTVNLHRTPIGGRNFECMSEDPFLTARIAVAYVSGLQAEGVAACIKHFIGNDTEFERNTIDSRIDERTLRELYLVPFEAAVKEAGVHAVMTSYNHINGPWAADSVEMIDGVLRGEWGFDGLVMSDWFGLHSTAEGVIAGCDLEMPGPTLHRGRQLIDAVADGKLTAGDVRRSARNVLRSMRRLGAFDDGAPGPEGTRDEPGDRALVRRAGAEGMVLLRNERRTGGAGVLPLGDDLRRVAVIGPNAARGQTEGGGSAHVHATHVSHPLDALSVRLGERGVEVTHAIGCSTHKRLPALSSALCSTFVVELFRDVDAADNSAASADVSTTVSSSRIMWMSDPIEPGHVGAPPGFSARFRTTFTPDVSGPWQFGVSSIADAVLSVDGAPVVDNHSMPAGGSFFGIGKAEQVATVDLDAGRPYALEVRLRRPASHNALSGLHIGAFAPVLTDPVAEAIDVAAAADLAILIVGTNDDWESEGYDRDTLALPGRQDELIAGVAAACPTTIVVVNAGSPVSMPWLDNVAAVVYSWFPGQEMGDSLVDVLIGDVEPQGRLPVSFPVTLEDTPAFEHHPGRNGVANYLEGRLIGYRWYDTVGREPLFPFGFGLGYTDVAISAARVVGDRSQPTAVEVDLTNASDRDGVQVVQVYAARASGSGEIGGLGEISDGDRRGDEPMQQLVGFAKIGVAAGDSATVTIDIDPRAMHTWSIHDHAWTRVEG